MGAAASSTRAIFMAGRTPSSQNIIDYVEIMTTGNALDFGNVTDSGSSGGGCSNGHGGLG